MAVAGLGLIFMARTGDGQSTDVTQNPDEPDVAAVGEDGSAAGTLAPADQLAAMDQQSIRLVDFGEVDQTVDLCDEGIGEAAQADLEDIELAGGSSDVIDQDFLSRLNVEGQAFGDISGDGVDEAVLHTACSYGASGRQHEVQVWDTSRGVPEPVGTVPAPAPELTGPLPSDVQGMAIADGVLDVTWSVYADDDPNCCPSDSLTLRYQLIDGEIVELD